VHFLLCHFLGARHIFLGQVCAEGKGSLQRAATVRTADRKIGQNVRRHGLDRLNASTIKQKKTPQPGACSARLWLTGTSPARRRGFLPCR